MSMYTLMRRRRAERQPVEPYGPSKTHKKRVCPISSVGQIYLGSRFAGTPVSVEESDDGWILLKLQGLTGHAKKITRNGQLTLGRRFADLNVSVEPTDDGWIITKITDEDLKPDAESPSLRAINAFFEVLVA